MYKTIKASIKPLFGDDKETYKRVKAEIKKVLAKQVSIPYTLKDEDFDDAEKAFQELGIPLKDEDKSWDVEVFATAHGPYRSADWYQPPEPAVAEDVSVILKQGGKEYDLLKYLTDSAISDIKGKFLEAYFEEDEYETDGQITAADSNPSQYKTPAEFTLEELHAAIRQDIISELDAINLYEAHKAATNDKQLKDLLDHIIGEEKEHARELQEFLDNQQKGVE